MSRTKHSDLVELILYGPARRLNLLDHKRRAYEAEYDRWEWRRKPNNSGFELVRNSSPNNDIIADEYMEIVNLTKREAPTSDHAEEWLRAIRGRAAVVKAGG